HPIQRYFGCWIFDSRAKKPGSSASTRSDQMRLRSRRSCIRCIGVPCIAKEGPRSGRDADVARLGEEAHGLQPALAAEAGLAHAAEGRPQVAHQPGVDPDDAGAELRAEAVGASEVAGPDRGRQAV